MEKKDIHVLLQIYAPLIVSIVSLDIIKPSIQLIIIVIYSFINYFILSEHLKNEPNFRKFIIIMGFIAVLTLLISAINASSINRYFINKKNAFVMNQNSTDKSLNTSNVNLASYIDKQANEIINKFKGTDNNIKISDENTEFSHYSKDEINEIIGLIEKHSKEEADTFSDFKNDKYLIELFYKMFLSEKVFYYSNYIEAFKEYGINIDKFDLNENTLITWDMQILFATYNMRCDNIFNFNSDDFLDEITYNYNDYKVKTQKYSDTFDYSNWGRAFKETTAKNVDYDLNNYIVMYYEKFAINFKSE